MTRYTQEFKVQCVEKVLSRRSGQSIESVANDLGISYSSLEKWIRLARENRLEKIAPLISKEKRPHDWNIAERLDALMDSHGMTDEDRSSYCRQNGIYPHHLKEWKAEFLLKDKDSKKSLNPTHKKLKQENKQLQKELNRKDRALSETAALLVLSKKCQAIWGEKVGD